MFSFFEKKINTTIHVFFLLGLIAVALGFVTLFDEFLARVLLALAFFLVGSFFLYTAYHMQELKVRLKHVFDRIIPRQQETNTECRPAVKRKKTSKKATA